MRMKIISGQKQKKHDVVDDDDSDYFYRMGYESAHTTPN
jgi:hypothetical protein